MKKYAIILSLIIFLACLAYSFYFQIKPCCDERAYDNIALNFLKGKGFTEKLDVPIEKDRAICYVGQGYILFLAGLYKLFGHYYGVVWTFQALFHSLTCLLIFFICLNLFKQDISGKIGLLAMAIYGFWPDLVESTAMLLTEPLFLFFAVLGVYFAIKFFKNPNFKQAFFASLAIGLGASIRPTLIVFVFVFAILLFVKRVKKWPIYLIIFIVIPTIILCAFMYRNYLQHGRFVFATAGGYDLWVGNNIDANGEFEPTKEIRAYFEEYGFRDLDKKGISEVKKFVLEHPFHFLKLQLIKASKYFSLIRPTGWWRHLNKIEKSLTLLFSGLFGAIGFVFGISGIWLSFKEKNILYRLLAYLAIVGPIPIILIVVETRYRYQIYPFLAIFAAYFIILLFQKNQSKLYKIPLTIFIILLLNSIFDLINSFGAFLEHLHRII